MTKITFETTKTMRIYFNIEAVVYCCCFLSEAIEFIDR